MHYACRCIAPNNAIIALKCGKAPGSDGFSPEIFKRGGNGLLRLLHKLFLKIWTHETVPQNFKDAIIVDLYKRKGDSADCNSHR